MKQRKQIVLTAALWCVFLALLFFGDRYHYIYKDDPISPRFAMAVIATIAVLAVGGFYVYKHPHLSKQIPFNESKNDRIKRDALHRTIIVLRILLISLMMGFIAAKSNPFIKDGLIVLGISILALLTVLLLKTKQTRPSG